VSVLTMAAEVSWGNSRQPKTPRRGPEIHSTKRGTSLTSKLVTVEGDQLAPSRRRQLQSPGGPRGFLASRGLQGVVEHLDELRSTERVTCGRYGNGFPLSGFPAW